VARVLIVGCGCRGLALADALPEHAIRGTTRSPERLSELEGAGVEGVVADPDRLATLVPGLAGVTVVCWLMGTVPVPELHEGRLRMLWEKLVDTPVRGVVIDPHPPALPQGEHVSRVASQTWQIPLEIIDADPLDHDAWLRAARGAVDRLLGFN